MDKVLKKSYFHILQLFSANILKAGFGFLGSIFVLRGWSTADIGDIYTLVGVLLLFYQIGDMGTGGGFIKMMTQPQAKKEPITHSYFAFKVIITLFLFLLFLFFLGYYFFISPSREILGLACVSLAAMTGVMGGYFIALLNAQQEYQKLSLTKTIPPLIKTLLIIVLFTFNIKSFYWLLTAFLIPPVISLILGYTLNTRPLPKIKFKAIFSKYGKRLYYISKWVCIINFCQTGFSQIDIFMLKRMSSDYQLAQFISAQKLSTIVLMLSQAVFTVMLPKMHDYRRNGELWRLTKKMFGLYIVFGVFMVPATQISPFIVPLIMGPTYIDSIPILNVFIFQALGGMFIHAQSLVFYRKNILGWYAIISCAQLLSNYAGNYLVIYEYKALGAIWVSAVLNNIFYFIMILTCLTLFKKEKREEENF